MIEEVAHQRNGPYLPRFESLELRKAGEEGKSSVLQKYYKQHIISCCRV